MAFYFGIATSNLPPPAKFRSGHLPSEFIPITRVVPEDLDDSEFGSDVDETTDSEKEVYGGRSSIFNDRAMTPVPERWKGNCETGTSFNPSNCNFKLIEARSFSKRLQSGGINISKDFDYDSPRDFGDYGTHTSSTAAGSHVALISYNMWILMMLHKRNIKWMDKFFMAESGLIVFCKENEKRNPGGTRARERQRGFMIILRPPTSIPHKAISSNEASEHSEIPSKNATDGNEEAHVPSEQLKTLHLKEAKQKKPEELHTWFPLTNVATRLNSSPDICM
ncbi:hypothetical protein IFM89_008924 [Coptis chinensis]|uniref:Uncharacterized protein n=1 Tax=Coptis chinensis TaxID=261450 RepID=A0A835LDV1_9MAGN|nr:hypothetical protein IFM89_008924 [Coptis chinensis]